MGSVVKGPFLLWGLGALLGCGHTTAQDPQSTAPGGASTAGGATTITGGAATGGGGAETTGGAELNGGALAAGGTGGKTELSVGGQPADRAPWPSLGCGEPASQPLGEYTTYSVPTTGKTLDPNYAAPASDRAYAVWLPPDYEPTHPHRTLFMVGACGGLNPSNDTRLVGDAGDREAIYVGLAGGGANGCVDNTGLKSVEWEYFALVADAVERTFCVDKNDELVLGTRSGGTLANMLGCYFSSVDSKRALGPNLTLRGQLSFASGLPKDLPACSGPIAALWMHDPNEINPISDSQASLERVLALNGCTDSATQAWGSDRVGMLGCKKYTDCPKAQPVIFCESPNTGRQSNYYDITAPTYVQFAAELSAP